jgi:hypothetical protein
MLSYQADDVLKKFVERTAAREATDMLWTVVWEAAETPHERMAGKCGQSTMCLLSSWLIVSQLKHALG